MRAGLLLPAKHGDIAEAVGIICAHPCQLVQDIEGFSFKAAAAIALRMSLERNAPERIQAGLQFALKEQLWQNAQVYLPRPSLLAAAGKLLGLPPAEVEPQILALTTSGDLVEDAAGDASAGIPIYLNWVYRVERRVAEALAPPPACTPWPHRPCRDKLPPRRRRRRWTCRPNRPRRGHPTGD